MGLGFCELFRPCTPPTAGTGVPVNREKNTAAALSGQQATMSLNRPQHPHDLACCNQNTQASCFWTRILYLRDPLPAMLPVHPIQVFGGHQIPEGLAVVVTAGNPPLPAWLRKSDPGSSTLPPVMPPEIASEVGQIHEAWKFMRLEHGVSRSTSSYLDIRPKIFLRSRPRNGRSDRGNALPGRTFPRSCGITKLGLYSQRGADCTSITKQADARPSFASSTTNSIKMRQAYNIDAILHGVQAMGMDVLTQTQRRGRADEPCQPAARAVFLQMERCTLRHDALRHRGRPQKRQRDAGHFHPRCPEPPSPGWDGNWHTRATKPCPAEGLSRSAVFELCPMARRTFRLPFPPSGLPSAAPVADLPEAEVTGC